MLGRGVLGKQAAQSLALKSELPSCPTWLNEAMGLIELGLLRLLGQCHIYVSNATNTKPPKAAQLSSLDLTSKPWACSISTFSSGRPNQSPEARGVYFTCCSAQDLPGGRRFPNRGNQIGWMGLFSGSFHFWFPAYIQPARFLTFWASWTRKKRTPEGKARLKQVPYGCVLLLRRKTTQNPFAPL